MMELTKEQLFRPGMEGIPACRSKIGFIDGVNGILEYRGYPIQTLAEHSTFEETSYLLLYGRLPNSNELNEFNWSLRKHRRLKFKLIDIIKCLPEDGHPMDALQAAMSALGMFHKIDDVMDEKATNEAVFRLIAKIPTIIATYDRLRTNRPPLLPDDDLGHSENFLYMLTGRKPSAAEAKMFDICMILHAEHGLNASTFTARTTGSTLADPYVVVANAIGTLSGPLHGGANERVIDTLRQIGSVEQVRPWMEKKIEAKEKIMGLGHRVYKTLDPRAVILQRLAEDLFKGKEGDLLKIAFELESIAKEKLASKGIYPNVDFYSGIVYQELGITQDLFTPIFAAARVSGWLAHWREQLIGNRIFRPSQIYEGDRNLPYKSISERE